MENYVREIPVLTDGEYEVADCGVCAIDDIIGTNANLCTVHYSDEVLGDPDHGYHYAYDYITANAYGSIQGYYIGNDRFCRIGNKWSKEYVLYEYAVFPEEDEGKRVNALLLSHLKMLARASGASRIICNGKGGDEAFYKSLTEFAFVEINVGGEVIWSLELANVILSERDAVILPREGESLGFDELFFFREWGFVVDSGKCSFIYDDDYIIVDRSTGACSFSERFKCDKPLRIQQGDRYALCIIQALCQLLCQKISGNIRLTPRTAKERLYSTEILPEITAGDIGIFIADKPITILERRALRERLRAEGKLKKYAVHSLRFDFELGGRSYTLGYANV